MEPGCGLCAEDRTDQGLGLVQVGAAEELGVIENVVKLVKFPPLGGAFGKRPRGGVSLIEGDREAPEKVGHGEVAFPVGEVDGGIKNDRMACGKADVSEPEVPVNEGGGGRMVAEQTGDLIEKAPGIRRIQPMPFGELQLRSETAVPEEGRPIP